jgi:hypothetical protein
VHAVAPEAPPSPGTPLAPTAVPAGLGTRLASARSLFERVRGLRGRGAVGAGEFDQVEEALLRADVGVATTTALVTAVR